MGMLFSGMPKMNAPPPPPPPPNAPQMADATTQNAGAAAAQRAAAAAAGGSGFGDNLTSGSAAGVTAATPTATKQLLGS